MPQMIGLRSMLVKRYSRIIGYSACSRCLAKGARVLDPKGRIFTQESIGGVLANRDLMAHLRDLGNFTGGPGPFAKRDRSRFLQSLDNVIQASFKAMRA